jgi:hypothetical protein
MTNEGDQKMFTSEEEKTPKTPMPSSIMDTSLNNLAKHRHLFQAIDPDRHWNWPENNNPWALEDEIIMGEPWKKTRNELEHFMHDIIIGYNNKEFDTDFYLYDVMRFATIWNKVHGNHFTDTDIYWLTFYAWEWWAKIDEIKKCEAKKRKLSKKTKVEGVSFKKPRYFRMR